MVGRDVLHEAVLDPVGRYVYEHAEIPLGRIEEVLEGLLSLRRDGLALIQERLGPVTEGGPAHSVDRERSSRLQLLLQLGRVCVRATSWEDPSRNHLAVDDGRRKGEGDIRRQRRLVCRGEVVEDRARLDRAVSDREPSGHARLVLEDVEDAVTSRVEAGHE
jgi:hypothetical protein